MHVLYIPYIAGKKCVAPAFFPGIFLCALLKNKPLSSNTHSPYEHSFFLCPLFRAFESI
jgi:hypothetical protein